MDLDCYAAADRGLMLRSRRVREALLEPVLRALSRCRIDAGAVTAASVVVGLAFVPLWIAGAYLVALAALALHVALDGIDGPLARFRGTATPRGAFADTAADQLIVATTVLALIAAGSVGGAAGAAFAIAYTAVIAFASVRNALHVPYTWLVRPRFAVYAWIPINQWLARGSFDLVLSIFALLLAWKAASGFVRIYRAL